MSDLTTYRRTEEVRVAMALNGGVSLAVWMGGCAVELDAARRADLGFEHVADGVPQRTVYHALCEAFQRVLVVDLMSGSSAGGINGALLAGAIAKGRRLHPDFVRDSWLEMGDFGRIMQSTANATPHALLQGGLFTDDLKNAFDGLIGHEPNELTTPLRSQQPARLLPALDVTTTDLAGAPRLVRDAWGQDLAANEYRARFRFRREGDFTPGLLASAARASASFPLAFEPFHVEGGAAELAGFAGSRWVIDGGLLENAPIDDVLAMIPARRADRQVRRFVCYMNADPTIPPEAKPDEPTLTAVGVAAVKLPRTARFVDQLYAIERATRQGRLRGDAPEVALLDIDIDVLEATAAALLPAYRQRRVLQSLEEILGEREARLTLDVAGQLPWIPQDLAATGPDGRWQWGLRPAQRALHVLLDALRRAAAGASLADRAKLFEAKDAVFAVLEEIEADRHRAVRGGDAPLSTAREAVAGADPMARIEQAVQAVLAVRGLIGVEDARLFGRGDGRTAFFVRRALGLEVVRRALATGPDVESDQELRFVQLTPDAPAWLFTSKPWKKPCPWRAHDKLLGTLLGHFAGFYRRSWRANDFMWGRLDAATRIVDMLVSPGRARQLAADAAELGAGEPPWDVLARWLTETKIQRQLVQEALDDAPADYPRDLACALKHDLERGKDAGMLTRILCARAAQLEILEHELPKLVDESQEDVRLGGGTPKLELGDKIAVALDALRDNPPAKRLLADDELASRLAVRTSAHAGLVTLAALRTAGMPLSRALFSLRAFLLPLAGSVAQRRVPYRVAVLGMFWATSLFLTARVVEINPKAAPTLDGEWPGALAVALLALLVVLGVAAVPAFRAARVASKSARRFSEAWWAFWLLAAGLGGIGLAVAEGIGVAQLIAAPGAAAVPAWISGPVVGMITAGPLVVLPAIIRSPFTAWLEQPWAGKLALIPAAAIAGLLAWYASDPLVDVLGRSLWQDAAVALAVVGAPLAAGYYLLVRSR